jgi:flagellar basal body-associated protein FliL
MMNMPMESRTINGDTKKKVLKIVIIAVFALAIIANGVQGYFLYKKTKACRVLDSIIQNKSNCDKCPEPAQVETPATTTEPTTTTPTTTTPKSKSKPKSSTPSSDSGSGSSSGSGTTPEPVIPPPPPPSD